MKYKVEGFVTRGFDVTVEASSVEEACQVARKLVFNGQTGTQYQSTEIEIVEEVE